MQFTCSLRSSTEVDARLTKRLTASKAIIHTRSRNCVSAKCHFSNAFWGFATSKLPESNSAFERALRTRGQVRFLTQAIRVRLGAHPIVVTICFWSASPCLSDMSDPTVLVLACHSSSQFAVFLPVFLEIG